MLNNIIGKTRVPLDEDIASEGRFNFQLWKCPYGVPYILEDVLVTTYDDTLQNRLYYPNNADKGKEGGIRLGDREGACRVLMSCLVGSWGGNFLSQEEGRGGEKKEWCESLLVSCVKGDRWGDVVLEEVCQEWVSKILVVLTYFLSADEQKIFFLP